MDAPDFCISVLICLPLAPINSPHICVGKSKANTVAVANGPDSDAIFDDGGPPLADIAAESPPAPGSGLALWFCCVSFFLLLVLPPFGEIT